MLVVAPLTFRRKDRRVWNNALGPEKIARGISWVPIGAAVAGVAMVGAVWLIAQLLVRLLMTSNYEVSGYMNGYPLTDDDWGKQFEPLFGLNIEQYMQDPLHRDWLDHADSYSYEQKGQ